MATPTDMAQPTANPLAWRKDGVVAFFGRFKTTPVWALAIGAINLVGIAYGFYYYRTQFAATPVWMWIFVPDSPLAVLWAELALVAWWARRKPGVLDALAFIGNVQVGLWTVYVLLAYADDFGTYTLNLNTILLAGHAGMAVLALIYLQGLRQRHREAPRAAWLAIGLATLYYLVNDLLDYFGPDYLGTGCGMRPYTVPCDAAAEPALTLVTFGLTLLGALALTWTAMRRTETSIGRE